MESSNHPYCFPIPATIACTHYFESGFAKIGSLDILLTFLKNLLFKKIYVWFIGEIIWYLSFTDYLSGQRRAKGENWDNCNRIAMKLI